MANVYLNEFDQEFQKRGIPFVRYADDIVLLATSERAAKRLLETSTNYLEGRLKLTVNKEKSRVVSVFAIRNFKFLGLALRRNGEGIYVRVHPMSWKKFKSKLKELSSRRTAQSIPSYSIEPRLEHEWYEWSKVSNHCCCCFFGKKLTFMAFYGVNLIAYREDSWSMGSNNTSSWIFIPA